MFGLFVALGIAILTLLAIVLWFLPYLMQQQAQQAAREAAHLRALINEITSEQEAAAMRQMQLGTSLAYLQDQVEQLHARLQPVQQVEARPLHLLETGALEHLEQRIGTLQVQLAEQQVAQHDRSRRDTESWLYLMDLLMAMQDQIKALSEQTPPQAANQR